MLKAACCFGLLCMAPAWSLAQDFNAMDVFPSFAQPMKYPALTPAGDYLIFLAGEEPAMTAFESYRKDGKWTPPAPFAYVNDLISSTGSEVGGFSFNHDGSTLYFHAKIEGVSSDIYFSRKTKAGWGAPVRVGLPVPGGVNLTSPAISSDNKTLFVLRDKATGTAKESCKELLLFEKDAQGAWAGPKYLPAEFNVGCQETPFFCADNNAFFYASKRADTDAAGNAIAADNYNIYFARRIDENNWFYPVYVEGLNTEHNELSPTMNSAGNNFLLSVKAKNPKRPPQKVYAAALPADKAPGKTFVLSGVVTDLYSEAPIETSILVSDAVTSVLKGEFLTTDEGRFSIILTRGASYKVDFSKEDYSHTFYYKDLTAIGKQTEATVNVALFNNVSLELNIYDGELFYPVSPSVAISDAQTGAPLAPERTVSVSEGKYRANLDIGRLYKIRIERRHYNPCEMLFDLRTDVVYSDFEKSIELQPARKYVTLQVKDKQGQNLLPVDIEVVNKTRSEAAEAILRLDEAGAPVLALRPGEVYDLNVSKKGYTYFNTSLAAADTEAESKDIVLDALTTQTKMVFNNITFETNSAELNAESYAELNRLVNFMRENAGIRIEIAAHTDDVGTQEYNARLSDKRAASVVGFLTDNAIASDRLQAKGYGKLQPIVANTSAENRAKNRRVEVRIIE
jgi:outer membrane protein OmpA-like peptidoglycan-associated protein